MLCHHSTLPFPGFSSPPIGLHIFEHKQPKITFLLCCLLVTMPPNQELHLSSITGKKIHLPQAASTALAHKPKPEPEVKHTSDRNPTHSKPASPPYTRSAPPAQIINHFRDFTNQHQQLWPFVQAIAPIFPLSQTLGPRAYHASRKHGCHHFSPKHGQRRHRSLQQDPPVSFFQKGERRTLHPECLRPRKAD